MQTGMVSNIQRFCLDDGPGIRTTVFLKGCPLRCRWCHNPETKAVSKEMLFDRETCILCGGCKAVCRQNAHEISTVHDYDRSVCSVCGACAAVCPTGALEVAGKEMTAEQVMEQVLRDREFYDTSSGGMTISGGEPLVQPAFSLQLLQLAKASGLHTCVETCGYGAWENLRALAEMTDLFLYDWKLTDPQLHKAYTGADNELIRSNLERLAAMGSSIVLRCPVIPGINDTQPHFEGIAFLANALPEILFVELEPYHSLGTDKSKRLDMGYDAFPVPSDEEKNAWVRALKELTPKDIKIG